MAKKISKEKRRKFISKISADGKISKKERKKAANKGISLQKIQNRNIGDYREAARTFDNRPNQEKVRQSAAQRPTYEPLKIKGGDMVPQSQSKPKKDRSAGIARREKLAKQEKKRNKKAKAITPETTPIETPTPETFAPDTPDFEAMLADERAANKANLEQMRADNEAAMEQYRLDAEEKNRQFELAQRTMLGNEARAGQQASYQFGGAAGNKRGGTFGFRRRKNRNLMRGISSTLAAGTGGMLNV